ncbi:MAG: alpha/beta hydrolase [Thaumarchaeota archaeon]|nr:alpha/beta hydrolase [Nitrososphaerota archaeon]
MREHYITVHGNKMRYVEDGSGPDIVLIHGLGSQAERWANVIPILSENHHVIAPDLIGFGFSDKPQVDYTPQYFVQFIFGLLQELGIKKTVMIGSSLGGQIVAEAAACDGTMIKKIVLISPTGTMRITNPTLDAYVMAALYPQRDLIRNAYQMMAGDKKNVDESTIARFHEAMSRPNAKMAFLSTVIGFKHWPAISTRLQTISIPSLVVWGSKDTMIPIEFADEYVNNLKNCKFIVMEGCGHRPHVEEPSKLVDVMLEFLGKKIATTQSVT